MEDTHGRRLPRRRSPGPRPEYGPTYYGAFILDHDNNSIEAFHNAGLEAGGLDNGAPGERPEYHPGYYGAYLLDPDSNNIEAVFHDRRA